MGRVLNSRFYTSAHISTQHFLSMQNSPRQNEPERSTETHLSYTQDWGRGALELYHSQPPGGLQTEKMPNSPTSANNSHVFMSSVFLTSASPQVQMVLDSKDRSKRGTVCRRPPDLCSSSHSGTGEQEVDRSSQRRPGHLTDPVEARPRMGSPLVWTYCQNVSLFLQVKTAN